MHARQTAQLGRRHAGIHRVRKKAIYFYLFSPSVIPLSPIVFLCTRIIPMHITVSYCDPLYSREQYNDTICANKHYEHNNNNNRKLQYYDGYCVTDYIYIYIYTSVIVDETLVWDG
jgi:hypothetical protein